MELTLKTLTPHLDRRDRRKLHHHSRNRHHRQPALRGMKPSLDL